MTSRIIVSALIASLLVPSLALAQTGASAGATVNASSSQNRAAPLPKLGPAIKNIASTTRDAIKTSASTTREAIKVRVDAIHALIEQHKEAVAERKATLELRVEAAKTKARAKFNERIQQTVEALVDKLTNATDKLDAMADRVEEYIGTLESEGKDMSGSEALLAEARADITTAVEKATAASAALDAALASSTPKTEMPKVRAAIEEARVAIRAAHASLREVVVSIRIEASAGAGVSE
ncbi:MAG: hypothetical protein AAB964_00435 [Patescibacteria group bacterium]